MKIHLKWILTVQLVFGAALIVTLPASAAVRFRGGFGVGPVIRPWGYAPYYGPYGFSGPYGPYVYPRAGEVKLDTKVKDAEVFINGAYAGTTGKLKSMWLRPNTYDLEIRHKPCTVEERIYVVAAKTLHVHADALRRSRGIALTLRSPTCGYETCPEALLPFDERSRRRDWETRKVILSVARPLAHPRTLFQTLDKHSLLVDGCDLVEDSWTTCRPDLKLPSGDRG